jgi:hypothetical protein
MEYDEKQHQSIGAGIYRASSHIARDRPQRKNPATVMAHAIDCFEEIFLPRQTYASEVSHQTMPEEKTDTRPPQKW